MNLSLIDVALAQGGAAAAKGPSLMESLLPIVFIMGVFYFFMIRPQQKKAKEHQSLVSNLKAGDEVVTSGGIIGKIRSVAETFVTVEVSSSTSIKVLKGNISMLTEHAAPKQQAVKS